MELRLGDLGDEKLYLVLAEAREMKQKNIEIIKKVAEKNLTTIVITTNQPYSILRKRYEKNGVDMSRIYFIDAITRYAIGKEGPDAENCKFINNPANLTDIGIAVSEVLKETAAENPCVLLDSVNTMLIYISSENITKFIHFITNKLRLMELAGIFLAVEKGLDPEVLMLLMSFVDEVIGENGG